MSRAAAREQALKLLFQWDIRNEEPQRVLEEYRAYAGEEEFYTALSETDETFMEEILSGVWDNLEEIDRLIAQNTKDWKISRLSKVLVAILRIAAYEMKYREDIPLLVSINEAVELAKNYDATETASAFVNGILGGVFKELDPGSD